MTFELAAAAFGGQGPQPFPPVLPPAASATSSRRSALLALVRASLLCRFLDAGGTEALHTRGGPASKKRQGAKSRGAGRRLGGERYGDFRLAARSMEAGHWGDATCMPAPGGGRESERSVPAGFEGRQRAPGALIAMNRVERDRRRRGAGATEREGGALTGGLVHDVSFAVGVGRHLGSQPRANTSITIMRAPQRGHGQRSARGSSGVASGCCCGSAAGGSAPSSARAFAMLSARLALAKSP
jgi:hypothetical protein